MTYYQNHTIGVKLTSDALLGTELAAAPDANPCPAPIVIGMIGGKWKLLFLQILIFQGTKRFGELRKSIDGVMQTMLTNQLRVLEADGLMIRKVYAEVPPEVEYNASEDGLALAPVFTSMHGGPIDPPRLTDLRLYFSAPLFQGVHAENITLCVLA